MAIAYIYIVLVSFNQLDKVLYDLQCRVQLIQSLKILVPLLSLNALFFFNLKAEADLLILVVRDGLDPSNTSVESTVSDLQIHISNQIQKSTKYV